MRVCAEETPDGTTRQRQNSRAGRYVFCCDGTRIPSDRMTLLIDVHHIGGQQTGNETLARNIGRELIALAEPGELVFAACEAGRAAVESMTGAQPKIVSSSALRRVVTDLPRIARQSQSAALLVQYTKPLTRRPCVVMIHDLSPFDAQSADWLSWRFRARVRASINHSARAATSLITPSEFTRQGLIERYQIQPERVVVAPSAVDPELAGLLDAAQPKDRNSGQQRVVAVGNVLPRKNLSILGTAVSRIRASGSAVELRIVGGISAAGKPTADQLKSTLGDAVSFTGYVSTAQLANEYAMADVFAFPSLFEGFGIPAIEAMYAGVPVISSSAGSLPEVVGDAGMIVAPDDSDAWTAALNELLSDADRRADLIERGGRRARQTSWRGTAAIVLEALREAAGHQRRSTSHERVR